ncbi:MAG: AAA domain protein [Candidatus Methanoperedenaceae archaeon GB50]|nr:MAG: AAA domain protein [Candidatus Methanoperedenaceae archaeon GB50]
MDEQKLENFYKEWLKVLPRLSKGYLYNDAGNLHPTRYIFSYFKKIIFNFLTDQIDETEKIILLPGIRGVGKTTLLMQIFNVEKFLNSENDLDSKILQNLNKLDHRFYLDASKLHLEQISLNSFFKFFEKVNNFNFISLDKKVILLLDEVHFDQDWSLFLKVLFDSTKGHKNLLIIATGSSAINLKISADLMRRSTLVELYPLKFNEYLILKHKIYPIKNLAEDLKKIIFNSKNTKEIFSGLKEKQDEVNRFFVNLPPDSEENFFKNGGFPFSAQLKNEVEMAERIKNVINGIIAKDIIALKSFKTETLSKINDLLYLLANSDIISYEKLLKSLRIDNIRTLTALLDVLVLSGILVKVKTYGTTYGTTRKTPKYLFITPSLRSAILNNNYPSGIEGKKLEDYFALIFQKDIKGNYVFGAPKLSYDIAEDGADFVLSLQNKKDVVIEVGFNKEEIKQVQNTMKKVRDSQCGLVIGSRKLELINNSIVKIPLRFLMLI